MFFTLFFSVFLCGLVISQDFGNNEYNQYSNVNSLVIKFQPYQFYYGSLPLVGEYGLIVEKKIGQKSSLVVEAAYLANGLFYLSLYADSLKAAGDDRITMNGVRVQLSYRFYLTRKEFPEGLFIAPHVSYATCKYSTVQQKILDNYLQGIHIDYSAIAGWQFTRGRFALDSFIGLTYRDRRWVEKYSKNVNLIDEEEIKEMYIFNSTIRPKFGFSLGFTL